MKQDSNPTPTKIPPPTLASALAAQDAAGLLTVLRGLDLAQAQTEGLVLRGLLAHPDVELARTAALAACRLRLPVTLSALRGILLDVDSSVGPDVLGAIEGWAAPEWLDCYRQLLDTADYPWKAQILQNLSHYGTADAARLLAAWTNRPEPELALPALIGLRRFPSIAHYRLAREALANPSREVAVEAARTVAAVGGKSALRELLRTARAACPEVQAETLLLARQYGDPTFGIELEPWLLHTEDGLVASALETIRTLKAPPTARGLAACLENPDARVRAEALRTAPLLTEREAADLLERGLADGTPGVQMAAVDGLASAGTPRAVDLLRRAVSLPCGATRAHALRTFFQLRLDEAPQIARQLLTDTAADVRREALRLLTQAGQAPEPERLQALMTDPDSTVRDEARSVGAGSEPDEAAQLAAAGFATQAASLLVNDIVENTDDPRPLFQLGILLYGRGSHDAALEKFLRVIELEPEHQGALRYAAWTYEQLGNREAQFDALVRLCALAPSETWAQRLLGLEAARAGRSAEVRDRLERVVAAEPADVEACFHLGAAHFEMSSLEPARRALEKTLDNVEFTIRAREMLADIALGQRALKEAEKHLSELLGASPAARPAAACKLARLMIDDGRPTDAVRLLQPVTRLPEPPAEAWLLGAEAALALDRAADCLKWADRCPLQENPDRRYFRGEALRRLGRCKDALADLEAAVGALGAAPERWLSLALCRDALGDGARALEALVHHVRLAGRTEPSLRLMEARLLRAGGRVAEALELLAPLADEEAPGPELYRELAGCYLATRQPGPALQNARRYLEALPGSDTATLLMGEAMLASADLEGARRYLQDLAARPGSPARVRRMLVRALAGLGEHDRVIELAEPLRDACRDEGSFCEELGVAYHARGQWALAGEWLGRAARLVEPGRALLLRLAETEFEAGNARASLEHATALSERFPEDAPAQRLRGLALLALDRGAEAVPYLRFAVTRLPEEPRVRSGLAVALARVRDDSEVLALYPDNTSLETATAEAVLAVASVLERAGRRKQAMDLLEVRAQAGRLSSAGISLFAGQCLRDGDVVRAEGLLNTALGAAPKDVELLASRAELMIHRGRPRAAQQDLHRALELAPERPGTLKLLGELELELENSKEAAALLSRYVRLVPADANGQLALGRAWLAQGQPEKAEKALRTAVELNGQDAPAVGELLLALLGSARQAEAATLLREFTAGRPERLHSLCERAASTARSDQQEPARWLWRELALAGAPVESALLPLVAGLLADGADRDAWNVILEAGTRAPGALPVLAAKLLSGNRPEIAREVYRRSFELNGRNVSDLKGVARCHLELGERDRAISLLGEVRSRCPGDVESGYLLAKLQAEAGDRAAAREALAQVLGREPDHLPALELKVELDLAAGDVDGAATTVEACLARDFGKAGFHRLKAAVCRARGQHADAEDAMLWAAGLDPSCERASCEAAELLWTRGDARGARDVLSRLLSADPDSRRGRLLMARLAAEQGDLESVLREWNETERRRRLDDRESEAYVMALWASGELEEGDRRANRLRLEHPESAISWLLSARMARRQANLEASVEFYQAALEREASLVEARSGLSDCLEALERRPEAAEQAAEALKLAPENREFRWRLGRLLASTSKWAAAVEALEPMLEEAGAHHQEARMLLARVSLTMANRARAIDLLAFDEDPTAEMLELLGDLYYEAESWDRAADAYGRLAVLPRPMPFEREFRRAQACARAGRLADAASALEGLMPGAAGNARVTPALAKLAQELGRKLAAERRHGQAVRVLEAALVRLEVLDAEQRVELLMTVAELQETAGDWQAVDQALGRALELAPSSSRVLETVASHHASDRSFERLRDRMQAVLRREPGAALAHLYLGAALCRLGMANAGQDACARAARLSPGSAQCHLGFARAARQAGDLEGSVGGYRRVLELEPNHPAALLELADVYDVAGLTALLVDHCKMMERLEGVDRRLARKGRAILARVSGMPEQPRPQVQTVESAMLAAAGQGRWAEARAYAESLLRVDPHHLNALLTSAQVGLQSGDANTVSRMLRTAVAQHPGSSQAHFEMARFRACQGDPEGARIAAYRALGIAPASAEYAGFLAGLLLKDGQFEAAETVLRDALAASGSADETLRCELARLSERRGDLASAVRLLSEPPVETAGSLRELARLLAAAGDWKGAARLHADLLTAGASEQVAAAGEFAAKCLASGQRPLALALVRELTRAGSPPVALCHQLVGSTPAGEPEPALAHALEAALAHLPLSATTAERTSLTLAFVRQLELAGRPADAVERLESVLELDPSCGEAQARLAALLSASQSHERLRDRFERIVARAPDSFTAWLHLASARLVLGKALASQEAAVRALALDGNRFEARLALARACRLSGEHDRSIAEYRHALRLQPNHPRALYELAATYAAANLGELARGQWSKLLKVAPEGSELARSAWRRLSKARA